jgi:hypothetical protein
MPKVARIYIFRLIANLGKFSAGAALLREKISGIVHLIMTVFKYPNFENDANLSHAVALSMNNVLVQEVFFCEKLKFIGKRAHRRAWGGWTCDG